MRNVKFFIIAIMASCLAYSAFAASEVQEFWVNRSVEPLLPGDIMCRCLIKHHDGEVDGKPVSYYGEYTLTYSEFDGNQVKANLKKQIFGAKGSGNDNSSVSTENRSCSVGSGKTHCFISIIQGVNLNVRIVDDQGGISVQK